MDFIAAYKGEMKIFTNWLHDYNYGTKYLYNDLSHYVQF
jgi:hypothetical protein